MHSITSASLRNKFPICRRLVLLLAGLGCAVALRATDEIEAVYAKTWNGYHRAVRSDNSYQPESYAFACGGRWDATIVDQSIDDLPFLKIAHTIAAPLKDRNYLTSLDPAKTDLLIFVYWGRTTGAEDGEYTKTRPNLEATMRDVYRVLGGVPNQTAGASAGQSDAKKAMLDYVDSELAQAAMMNNLENEERDSNNFENARMLGFKEDLVSAWELQSFSHSQNLIEEIEADRYFVILKAYDFRVLAQKHKKKLLWETRFSIRARGNRFDEQLAGMTKYASQFFGQDLKHLLRRPMREGHVEVGTPTVVEAEGKK